ncbi:MAG TPA: multidrug RND transporter [Chlorobaculum parvum]|uniref:Multidrug RND transporter n=1 Tax=Chlorobaculum parvum TaxID=274539 RepID=A0A7C5DGY4_9CHLB|nr:multidrug RND transporter [Chlorobaculum parvum]
MSRSRLDSVADLIVRRPWWLLAAAVVLTAVLGSFAMQLRTTMRWIDLLPADHAQTRSFETITREFTTASSITVVVQGDPARIRSYADDLAPLLREIRDPVSGARVVKRVDYKKDTRFISQHALMLADTDYLAHVWPVFSDPSLGPFLVNLNDALETEYLSGGNALSGRQKQERTLALLDGLQAWLASLHDAFESGAVNRRAVSASIDRLLCGEPYFISYDRRALILNVIPEFGASEVEKAIRGVNAVETRVNTLLQRYPGLSAGLAGPMTLNRDKVLLARENLNRTTLISFAGVLLLLAFAFRSWLLPLLAVATLGAGILWAMGAASLLVGKLNLMTSVMGVILVGLGIDFSIHLIHAYRKSRIQGLDCRAAIRSLFVHNMRGIVTGALTTSAAFLALMTSESRGMNELGLVTAAGLLAVLAATLLLLPALLVVTDGVLKKGYEAAARRKSSSGFSGRLAELFAKHRAVSLGVAAALCLLFGIRAFQITFDRNSFNLEPRQLTSVKLQETVARKFDLSMDYALVLSRSPREERAVADKASGRPTVAMVDGVHQYAPAPQEQMARRVYLDKVGNSLRQAGGASAPEPRQIIDQLRRLEQNIIEIQDMAFLEGRRRVDRKCAEIAGDPEKMQSPSLIGETIALAERRGNAGAAVLSAYEKVFNPLFRERACAASSSEPIDYQMLPESLKKRYANQQGDRFLLTVFPEKSVWKDLDFLKRFSAETRTLAPDVTGLPLVFDILVSVMMRDASIAFLLALAVVYLLLWIDFRNPVHALIALVPLVVGLIWMIGIMQIAGLQLTIINVMAFTLVAGIGIDDGVHIVHRWRSEGKGRIRQVFDTAGLAVLLTTLTTMTAFGALMFSTWPTFVSLGSALFIGSASTWLATFLVMPTLLAIADRWRK